MMDELADDYQTEELVEALDVSRSGYYAWKNRGPSAWEQSNAVLMEEIEVIYDKSRKTYGSPRVTKELQQRGYPCGENRVARLMRQEGLQGMQKKRYRPKTTDSNHDSPISPNLLRDVDEVTAANEVWVADITYIPTREGWLYLAAIMDRCTRRIVGWALSDHMRTDLVSEALVRALEQQRPEEGLIHHSDRGSQYASAEYRNLLRTHRITGSMSRSGNCYDNAAMESFFGTLKTELLRGRSFSSKKEARVKIFDYIEIFYNRQRLHSSIGYKSPVCFELSLKSKRN